MILACILHICMYIYNDSIRYPPKKGQRLNLFFCIRTCFSVWILPFLMNIFSLQSTGAFVWGFSRFVLCVSVEVHRSEFYSFPCAHATLNQHVARLHLASGLISLPSFTFSLTILVQRLSSFTLGSLCLFFFLRVSWLYWVVEGLCIVARCPSFGALLYQTHAQVRRRRLWQPGYNLLSVSTSCSSILLACFICFYYTLFFFL